MRQKYQGIFKRLNYIYRHPVSCWDSIAQESFSPGWYFKKLVLPMIAAIAVVNFLGYLFFALAIHDFSIAYALVKAIAVSCESFFSFYISFLIIVELRSKLKVEIEEQKLFKIMLYSITPLWSAILLSGFLANYATLSSFLKFLGIYGVILFAAGIEQMHAVVANKRGLFIFVCFSIVLVIYLLLSWSFSFALKAIQYSDMLSQ